jgi:hypothetical protein
VSADTRGRPPRRAPGWWSAGGRERGYGGDIAPDPGVVFVWRMGGLTLSSHEHRALARDAAAREIIAGVAFYGGEAGLKELAADLVVQLAAMIEQLAAAEGRSAVEVADDLFRD